MGLETWKFRIWLIHTNRANQNEFDLNPQQLRNYPRLPSRAPELAQLPRQKPHRHICFLPSLPPPPHPLLSAARLWLTPNPEGRFDVSLQIKKQEANCSVPWWNSGWGIGAPYNLFFPLWVAGRMMEEIHLWNRARVSRLETASKGKGWGFWCDPRNN